MNRWEQLQTFLDDHLTDDGASITVAREAHGWLCEIDLDDAEGYVGVGATARDAFNAALGEAYRRLEIPL